MYDIMLNHVIAVTDRHEAERPYLEQIRRIVSCHPVALILREKDLTADEYYDLAVRVKGICDNADVPLVIHNFDIAAEKLDVRFLHLPFSRCSEIPKIKALHEKISIKIGCSVHSSEDAKIAEAAGADYLIAGHVYNSTCKPGITPRGLDFLTSVCRAVAIPVYAIGGIGLSDGRVDEVMKCGAAGACIRSQVMKM